MAEQLNLPPGRSLEYVKPLPPDEDGNAVFETFCDCATTTILHIAIDPLPPGAQGTAEAAFTCDGCRTSHWFRVTVKAGEP
jgi:hypothetical protein